MFDWRRIVVSLCAAIEVPFAIGGGLNLVSHPALGIVLILIAIILNFIYAYTKPYWQQ